MTKANHSEMNAPKPLRILIIEDSEDDVLLIIRLLKKGGYDPEYERVETAPAMHQLLQDKTWDIILSDYKMPHFNGPDAIALLKATNRDIPIIIVSGAIGEETAVECMRLGAHDYIMKSNLLRLVPAIERELDEASSRRERRLAEEAVVAVEFRFKELFERMSSCAAVYEVLGNGEDFIFKDFNRAAEITEKMDRKNVIGKSVLEVFPGARKIGLLKVLQGVWKTGRAEKIPPIYYKDSRIQGWRVNYIYKLPTGEIVQLYNDITERKNAERQLFESEEKYRLLVENSSEAILIAQDGMLKFVNQASLKMFDASYEVMISEPFTDFIHPDDRKMVMSFHYKRLSSEAVPSFYNFRIMTAGGAVRWVEIHSTVVPWQGKPATLNFLTDITERKLAEEALRESEKQFRTLADSGTALIWTCDTDQKNNYFNRPWLKFTGRTMKQEQGDGWTESVHPDDLARRTEFYTTAFNHRERFSITYRLRHHSGEYRWLQDDGTPRQDASGNFLGYIGNCLDITARKLAEEQSLQQSRLLAYINRIFYETMTVETEKEIFQSCLTVAMQLTGSKFGFIGEITPEGLFSPTALSEPECEARHLLGTDTTGRLSNIAISGIWGQVLLKGRSLIVNDPLSFPDLAGTPEGHPPLTSFLGVPMKLQNKTIGMFALVNRQSGYAEDMRHYVEALSVAFVEAIQHKRAETALRESEELLRSYLEHAPDGVFMNDRAGNFLYGNLKCEEIIGYRREEMIGKNMWELNLVSENSRDKAARMFKDNMQGNFAGPAHIDMINKDGRLIIVEITATVVRHMGQTIGLSFIRDITERKLVEEELEGHRAHLEEMVASRTRDLIKANSELSEENNRRKAIEEALYLAKDQAEAANQAKSVFLANMSHELRTPLNSIMGFAEVLQKQLFGPLSEKQLEYAKFISSSGDHLLNLINDILDLSKVEAGKLELTRQLFSLKEMLTVINMMFREKAFNSGIQMSTEIAADIPAHINADERAVKQIMFNLLSNALKFTPEGGSVTTTAKFAKDTNCVILMVEDTGIGIKTADLQKLFQPFSQIESPYTKTKKGTGLGLALTKRLVDLHNGTVSMESQWGKGSKVTVTIPAGT